MERRERRRRAISEAVNARLDRLAETGVTEWLPMPYGRETKRLPFREWTEYRLRQARQREKVAGYDAGWKRPTAPTAEFIWKLLAPVLGLRNVEKFIPPDVLRFHDSEPAERPALLVRAQQAVVVVLDRFIVAGHRRRMVTLNDVFDALAALWSDHYRLAQKHGRVSVRDLREATAAASWRDLLRNGIRVKALWAVATKSNVLYHVERVSSGNTTDPRHGAGGYQVRLNKRSAKLRQLEALIYRDPTYRRPADTARRLLFADDPLPRSQRRTKVCAEQRYNVVELGHRSRRLLNAQQRARLFLDVGAFRADYRAFKAEVKEVGRQLRKQYRLDPDLSTYRPRIILKNGRKVRLLSTRQKRCRELSRQIAENKRDSWWQTILGLLERYDKAQQRLSAFSEVAARLDARVAPDEKSPTSAHTW